jgi:uridine kinase
LNNRTHIIGITGGSGSGKSFLCKQIIDKINKDEILIITVDSYYKDLSNIEFEEREKNNFDHPISIEFNLLYNHLLRIKQNEPVDIPIYNYKTHTRKKEAKFINKKYSLILLEGIFSLYDKKIREIIDNAVFIDIPNKIRKERRIIRDTKNRDRTVDSIITQYDNMVVPMFEKYIKPMKEKSDIIIKKFEQNDIGYSKLMQEIQKIINA